MIVRPSVAEEMPAVLDLVAKAFAEEPAVVDLVRDLAVDPAAFIPQFSLVAEDAGAIVGYVLFTRAWVEHEEGWIVRALCLAPLAVAPDRQQEGIGSALVEAGLDAVCALGEQLVFVLGDPAFYGRFGFEPAHPKGMRPPHPVELEAAWQVRALEPGAFDGVEGVVHLGEALEDPKHW
jgi:putative acetyltransferase